MKINDGQFTIYNLTINNVKSVIQLLNSFRLFAQTASNYMSVFPKCNQN